MCDNAFFKDFKNDVHKFKWNTFDEKKKIITQTWDEFPGYRIQGYWEKCGYLVRAGPKKRKALLLIEEEEKEINETPIQIKIVRQPTIQEMFAQKK